MIRLWLVTYDIGDDDCRQKVHDILKDHGKRVQYSVFECHLSDSRLHALRARLLEQIDSGDSLRWYPLCSWCGDAVFYQGLGLPPEDEAFFLQ
ncbi:MAG: CRISPR-associated endonuclease Cas2 [Methylobacter sp.]